MTSNINTSELTSITTIFLLDAAFMSDITFLYGKYFLYFTIFQSDTLLYRLCEKKQTKSEIHIFAGQCSQHIVYINFFTHQILIQVVP